MLAPTTANAEGRTEIYNKQFKGTNLLTVDNLYEKYRDPKKLLNNICKTLCEVAKDIIIMVYKGHFDKIDF